MGILEYLDFISFNDKTVLPEITDREFVDFIKRYLLGEDWQTVLSVNEKQANAEILIDVLNKYSRIFKKELKKHKKRSKKIWK